MGDLVTHGASRTRYVVSDIRGASSPQPLWDMRPLLGGGEPTEVALSQITAWPIEARCGKWNRYT